MPWKKKNLLIFTLISVCEFVRKKNEVNLRVKRSNVRFTFPDNLLMCMGGLSKPLAFVTCTALETLVHKKRVMTHVLPRARKVSFVRNSEAATQHICQMACRC